MILFKNKLYNKKKAWKVVKNGTYKGYEYYIKTNGHFPMAYIKTNCVIDTDSLIVHEEITYKEKYLSD